MIVKPETMDIPLPLRVADGDIETLPKEQAHLELQARSLRNTLMNFRRKIHIMEHHQDYTIQDLEHYKRLLDHLERRWRDEEGTMCGQLTDLDPKLQETCSRLWTECYDLVSEMEERVLEMPEQVQKIHWKLTDLHRQLLELLNKGDFTSDQVMHIVAQLDAIDNKRHINDGALVTTEEGKTVPGQRNCEELLAHNYELVRECARIAHAPEKPELRAAADALRGIANDLRKLSAQKHHTDADIAHHRFQIMAIASAEAEYGDEWKGSTAESLLKECLQVVERLEKTSEQMQPKVTQIYRQLRDLKHALTKAESSTTERPSNEQIEQWKAALHAIDDTRAATGGVFGGEDEHAKGGIDAPPGQAVCTYLLNECYKILGMLLEGRDRNE